MNAFKSASLLACGAFLLLATSCELFQPAQEKFSFRTGDYTVYENVQLDSSGNTVANTTTRSTRTVLRTGVSIGSQTDAALVVDSLYTSANRLSSVDTTYYRVANNEVFTYFDLGAINQVAAGIGGGGISAGTVTGFEAKWVKIAELNDAAGTADFTQTEVTATINAQPFGAIALVARFSGKNLGATDLTIGTNRYRSHRQTQTFNVSASLPVVGRIQIATPVTYDFGIPSQSSTPRTILRTEQKAASVTVPIVGTVVVPGSRSTMTSFRAGSTL